MIFREGILAITAIVSSISFSPIIFFLDAFNFIAAPVSSITSIALSGNFLSLIYLEDNSTAQSIASSEYLSPWKSSKRDLRPFRILIVSSLFGSSTSIF